MGKGWEGGERVWVQLSRRVGGSGGGEGVGGTRVKVQLSRRVGGGGQMGVGVRVGAGKGWVGQGFGSSRAGVWVGESGRGGVHS